MHFCVTCAENNSEYLKFFSVEKHVYFFFSKICVTILYGRGSEQVLLLRLRYTDALPQTSGLVVCV